MEVGNLTVYSTDTSSEHYIVKQDHLHPLK